MAESFYSDDLRLPDRAPRDPQQRRQGYALLEGGLRREVPGYATDNRLEQSNHLKGAVYLAGMARYDSMSAASVGLLKRRRRNRHRTTFGPGGKVAKALPTAHAESRDEEYVPFDDQDHPLAKAMAEPNDNEDIGELLGYLSLQLDLTGSGVLWCVPNGQGKPVEFHALPTALCTPQYQRSERYPNGAWRVTPFYASGVMGWMPGGMSNAGAVIPGEEVSRIKKPHPYCRWDGYSPLTAGAVQLDILEAIDQSRWSAFNNGVQLDMLAVIPGISEGSVDRFREKFEGRHAGSRNAKRIAILAPDLETQGRPILTPLQSSNREMDFSDSWEQAVGFALALYGTPRGVVGLESAGSYSKLYADLRQYHHRQGADARRAGKLLTRCAARPWNSFPGEFLVQVDLQKPDDPELQEQQIKTDVGILTVNQRHALRNRPPVEFGEYPEEIFKQLLTQKAMPQPAPGTVPGAAPGGPAAKPLPGSTPTGGAAPKPGNPASEGSKPPAVGKAMSTLTGSDGGFLVPDGACPARRKRKIRRAVRVAKSIFEGL